MFLKLIVSALFMVYILVFTVAKAIPESAETFVKIRCSIDGSDTFYTWQGSIYSYMKQTDQVHLLDFIGYNVARCEKIDGVWQLITRELSYYLNPKTKERLSFWDNPFTNETVNVMHVANDPVNNEVYPTLLTQLTADTAVINQDVPLFYPQPMHGNLSYWPYGGLYEYYEGGEFFKFYFSLADLKTAKYAVEDVAISWTRVSQWLPWMKMGKIEGGVFYSCVGGRAKDLSGMPEWLQEDVYERLPLYTHAPRSFNPEEPNESSITVFMENFDEYLAGAEFPLPAPDEPL